MAADMLEDLSNNLIKDINEYEEIISQRKHHNNDLDIEVAAADSNIQIQSNDQRRRREKHRQHIAEKKLNQATVMYQELLHSNNDCYKDIEHLLLMKAKVSSNLEDFDSQMAVNQNTLDRLLEMVNSALHTRSEAEVRALVARRSMETVNFTNTQSRMRIRITHDSKLLSFMETKLQQKTFSEDDEDSRIGKQHQYLNEVKKLEMYSVAYKTLMEITGKSDLRQMAQVLAEIEHKSLVQSSYVGQQHMRINKLKKYIKALESKILLLQQEIRACDEQRENELKALDSEATRVSCLADSLEQRCSVLQMSLDQIRSSMQALVDGIMPEVNAIVTSDTITHYAGKLEEIIPSLLARATEIEDDQKSLPPEKVLLSGFNLLSGHVATEPITMSSR